MSTLNSINSDPQHAQTLHESLLPRLFIPQYTLKELLHPHYISYSNYDIIQSVIIQGVCHRERQLYGIQSLHPPGHPVTATALRKTTQQTNFLRCTLQ
jgi:hypothetical protein